MNPERLVVWCMESVGYPEEVVFYGVWSAPLVAYESMKARHGKPYIVEWSEPVEEEGEFTFHGVFERVDGYSTAHNAEYRIWREEVDGR